MSTETSALLLSLAPPDLKQLSRKQKVQLVHEYRTSSARNPNLILFLATDVLAGGSSGISTIELYEIYETVLIASLECGKLDNALNYLNLLEKKFGRKSVRVTCLRGLCLEAEGNIAGARKLYHALLEEVPTDDFSVKRLSAIYKSEGNFAKAIEVLQDRLVYVDEDGNEHKFTEVHRGDALVTYRELSELNYLTGNLDKAIYYAEEAMLFSIGSYTSFTRLGELYYAAKNYINGAMNFAQSLQLNSSANNARAAYGLWQATREAVKQHNSNVQRLETKELTNMQDLRDFAADTLRSMYADSPTLFALDAVLERNV